MDSYVKQIFKIETIFYLCLSSTEMYRKLGMFI